MKYGPEGLTLAELRAKLELMNAPAPKGKIDPISMKARRAALLSVWDAALDLVRAAERAEEHDKRATELLEANNREVERRRSLVAALRGARDVIAAAPRDAWGSDGLGHPATPGRFQSWSKQDEHLHYIDKAIADDAASPLAADEMRAGWASQLEAGAEQLPLSDAARHALRQLAEAIRENRP